MNAEKVVRVSSSVIVHALDYILRALSVQCICVELGWTNLHSYGVWVMTHNDASATSSGMNVSMEVLVQRLCLIFLCSRSTFHHSRLQLVIKYLTEEVLQHSSTQSTRRLNTPLKDCRPIWPTAYVSELDFISPSIASLPPSETLIGQLSSQPPLSRQVNIVHGWLLKNIWAVSKGPKFVTVLWA